MLIEFLGLPGSGKSTLSRLLAEHFVTCGQQVGEPTYTLAHELSHPARLRAKLRLVGSFIARHPHLAASDLLAIRRTRQASPSEAQKLAFNWLYIASLCTDRPASSTVTILDQGIAQAVWSVALSARRKTWLKLLTRIRWCEAAAPHLVVRVHADPAILAPRLDARCQRASRMDHLGGDLAALRRADAICDVITARVRATGIEVLDVVSNVPGDLTTSLSRIGDVATALVAKPCPPAAIGVVASAETVAPAAAAFEGGST
jgi:hypothetical protein